MSFNTGMSRGKAQAVKYSKSICQYKPHGKYKPMNCDITGTSKNEMTGGDIAGSWSMEKSKNGKRLKKSNTSQVPRASD